MFSKSRVTETPNRNPATLPEEPASPVEAPVDQAPVAAPHVRQTPSVLSSDLTIKGDLQTAGDVQIEGTIEGDIRARQLTIGNSAIVRGEVLADEVIVNGRVIGRLRGIKVRLSSTARVEGDIIHKTIAIESGAHFEGSVQRQEDPLSQGGTKKLAPPAAKDHSKPGE
ncbi:MAG: polymer-forming cytoskeletal protein [Paracoccus sp. (in: a-proteobacteria)]|nr:polymer-forming cytoskeletal protein [Paracoccus sp. (in: a-proteobacteria)]